MKTKKINWLFIIGLPFFQLLVTYLLYGNTATIQQIVMNLFGSASVILGYIVRYLEESK